MSEINRREFLLSSAALGASVALPGTKLNAASVQREGVSVSLSWLGNQPPKTAAGVAWGVPWPRGVVPKNAYIGVRDREGKAVQVWPMALLARWLVKVDRAGHRSRSRSGSRDGRCGGAAPAQLKARPEAEGGCHR